MAEDQEIELEYMDDCAPRVRNKRGVTVEPCPFCGGTSLQVQMDYTRAYKLICKNCWASGPLSLKQGPKAQRVRSAIVGWNEGSR